MADSGTLVAHQTLTGRLCAGGRLRLEKLMEVIRAGRVDPTLLITHKLYGFEKIEDGFDLMGDMRTPEVIKPIVYI